LGISSEQDARTTRIAPSLILRFKCRTAYLHYWWRQDTKAGGSGSAGLRRERSVERSPTRQKAR